MLITICLGACATTPPDLRIAFMSDRDGDFDIYLMNTEGENLVNLTADEAINGVPDWSPEARAFVYLTEQEGGSLGVYTMAIDGSDSRQLVGEPSANAGPPRWSPDGGLIAFGAGEIDAESGALIQADIFVVDADGENLRNLTNSASLDRFGDWSPDGRHIVFSSNIDGNLAVYTIEVATGETTRLTDPAYVSATPDWSPDGNRIAYLSERDGDVEIYTMDTGGGDQVRLTESPGPDAFPRWSPDGTRIAFVSFRDGNPELYAVSAAGGTATNLTREPGSDAPQGSFTWSPDGTQLLFHTDREGDLDIFVMDANGDNPRNLTQHLAVDLGPIWVR